MEDNNLSKRHAYCAVVLNMVIIIIVLSGGSYLVLIALTKYQEDWNMTSAIKQISNANYYNLSILANLAIVIFIFIIGLVLTLYALWNIRFHSRPKYTLIPFFLIKSVELGGLVYCEFCLITFALIVPNNNNERNEDEDISSFFFMIGMLLAVVKICDIYVLVSLVKFDETVRKNVKNQSSWRHVRTALQHQSVSLIHSIELCK